MIPPPFPRNSGLTAAKTRQKVPRFHCYRALAAALMLGLPTLAVGQAQEQVSNLDSHDPYFAVEIHISQQITPHGWHKVPCQGRKYWPARFFRVDSWTDKLR